MRRSDVDRLQPFQLVIHYLAAGWLYETRDAIYMTDDAWDWLCVRLDREWDTIEHRHKHIIDRPALATGTASYLTDETVPLITRRLACRLEGSGRIDPGRSYLI